MAIVNVLLCRWTNGFHEVTRATSITTHGRREAFLSLANAPSTAEVDRIANAEFDRIAEPQESVTVALEPAGAADTPYAAFAVADTVAVPDSAGVARSRRVRGITVTEDAEGNPIFVPELQGPA